MTSTSSARTAAPAFHSLVFEDIPVPDHADSLIVPLPAGADPDPRLWAETIFSTRTMPRWIFALLGFRQILVRLVGIAQTPSNAFQVQKISGEEALIALDEKHLDFRCGVGVDATAALVRVSTAVRFNGWRGRCYFAFVRPLHPLIVRAMMRKAARTLSSGTRSTILAGRTR